MRIELHHGDNYFFVNKGYIKVKNKLLKQNNYLKIISLSSDSSFKEYSEYFTTSGLFDNGGEQVLIKNIFDGNKISPFLRDMVTFLESYEYPGDVFLFAEKTIPKNTFLYKFADKHGKVYEYKKFATKEIVEYIRKEYEGIIKDYNVILKLLEYTGNNMFRISQEMKKLKLYLKYKGDKEIGIEEIEEVCVKDIDDQLSWDIGKIFLRLCIYKIKKLDTNSLSAEFLDKLNFLRINNVSPMMIFYSFYFNVLSAIKLTNMIERNISRRECYKVGYFFVNEFYDNVKDIPKKYFYRLNKYLLDTEFMIKVGKIDDSVALKKVAIDLL